MSKKKPNTNGTIAQNKKARHNYILSDKFEAGLELQGWEVKSIRAGKVNLTDAYVVFTKGEAYLMDCQIQPLNQASSHVVCDPDRQKKLLLKSRELEKLMGSRDRQGMSIIATVMYWKKCWVKVEIYLGKGKHEHDKRDAIKDRDWARDKERMMKNAS